MTILAACGIPGAAIGAIHEESVAAIRANPCASKVLCTAMRTRLRRLIHVNYVPVKITAL